MPDSVAQDTPDYAALVRMLVEPFLEQPSALKVDCEVSQARARVWVRLAFESADKGRVFGRGGRNIQAIRTVLGAAAQTVGHSAHLDIYGTQSSEEGGESETATKPQPRRASGGGKEPPKLRST
ncbi:MAG TPA: KH domain-containing protein [Thermosynechococcaceae cyanobacterium]